VRRLQDLEASEKKATDALGHLRGTVQEQYQELRLLRARLRDKEEALGVAVEDARQLRDRADDAARGTAVLRKHLSIFAGADGTGAGGDPVLGAVGGGPAVPLPELEEALAIVRRRADGAGGGDGDDGPAEALAAGALARRLKDTRVLLLDAQQQSERHERLLAAQREQIRDLESEASRLRDGQDAGLAEARGEAEELRRLVSRKERALVDLRDQRVALLRERGLLQQQVRKLAASAARGHGDDDDDDEEGTESERQRGVRGADADGDGDLLEESASTLDSFSGLSGHGTGLGLGEMKGMGKDSRSGMDSGLALEVWVESGEVTPALLGPSDSSFVAVDAWDFETQCSPLAAGPAPGWNFAPVFPLPAAAE